MRLLPAAPLLDAIGDRHYSKIVMPCGMPLSHQTLKNIQESGMVEVDTVDDICIGLGVHPLQLYSEREWGGPYVDYADEPEFAAEPMEAEWRKAMEVVQPTLLEELAA